MVLSRAWSIFLVAVGAWSWLIWPRFAVAIWNDPRAWSGPGVGDGPPTGFFWVHALLIVVSLAIGTAVGLLGVKGWWARRRHRAAAGTVPAGPEAARPAPPG